MSHSLNTSENQLQFLTAAFITILIVSNIVSIKLIGFGPIVFDAGTILFPFAYIIGDIVTELYGFRRMRRLVINGVIMLAVTFLTLFIVGALPGVADWTGQEAYDMTLGVVWRIITASIIAIFCGELLNALVLTRLKAKYAGKHLWGRLIGSTAIGSLVDTVLFSVIAFAGTVPAGVLVNLIVTVYLIKVLVEIIVSPLTVIIIKRLRRDIVLPETV